MGGKTATLTQRDTRLSNIRIQTSSQGLVIPKGWGRYRVGCNLVWYDDFKAIEHKSVDRQGGKGGGGGVKTETITYTYQAAIIVVLGHGVGNGVVSAWKGKERIPGVEIPERVVTYRHEVTVPDLGGSHGRFFGNGNAGGETYVVTVPPGLEFVGAERVYPRPGTAWLGRMRSVSGDLVEGYHYTRVGNTYTFNANTPARVYVIQYRRRAEGFTVSALSQMGLSFQPGLVDQEVWPWLQSAHPDQALAYPGMMIAYSSAYDLNQSAELYNHNFEVSTPSELGMLPGRSQPVFDADPAEIVFDVVTDDSWAAGWQVARISGLDRYSDYCVANGFWLSPVLEEQSSAAEYLEGLLQLTNTDVVWDGEELVFVPLGDEDVSANGRTFVAETTPIVDINYDHLQADAGAPPLKIRRHYGQDGSSELAEGDDVGFNVWTLEIENRDNGYNTEPVSYEDTAHILLHGRRQKDTIKAKAIKKSEIGMAIATLLCQSELSSRNVYEFKVPWTMGFLRPLHLVTLTDSTFDLDRKPVRILTIDEEDDEFTVTARDCDIGQASAPAYGVQSGSGYQQDYGASPGPVAPPVIFEPPVELTTTGLELWIAVTGTSPLWGGCEVWASMDGGDTYRRMYTVNGGARYGQLASVLDTAPDAVLDVQLAGRGGQLLPASPADAAALNSLVMVRTPGGEAEFMAYTGASLFGGGRYTLDGLVRGGYDTVKAVHPAGSEVVRVDDLVSRGEPLQLSMIGQQIKFKLLSFNVFGGGLQGLEDVQEYSYTVTGAMVRLPPRNVASFTLATQGDGTRVFSWAWGSRVKPPDLRGYVVRYRQGGGWVWDEMLPFVTDDGFFTSSPIETNQLLAGPYTFAIKTLDQLGIEAADALYIEATLPDPRLGNALVFRQLHVEGWPGTITNGVRDVVGGASIIRAADQAVWEGGTHNIPSTWAEWTRWVWDPFHTMVYEPPVEDFGAVVSVLPIFHSTGFGDALLEESHGDDGVTWSAWGPVAGVVMARHVRLRITLSLPPGSPTGPGVTPLLTRETGSLSFIGRVDKEYGNDVSPAALGSPHRIGVGHFRLPTGKAWAYYSRVGLVLQNVGAGWTWELVDKDLVNGPAVKTYNASGALADPPLIDFDIEGILTS